MTAPLARLVTFTLHPHDNADALALAKVSGTDWQAVVRLADWLPPGEPAAGQERTGVYVGLDALVDPTCPSFAHLKPTKSFPDGRPGHRVKTIRLRGKLSQGVLVPVPQSLRDRPEILDPASQDWPLILGVERYEPPVPADLRGEMVRCPGAFVAYGGIENAKNHATFFADGEPVVVSEKLHGSSWRAGLVCDGRDEPVYMVGTHATARDPMGTNLYSTIARRDVPEAKLRSAFACRPPFRVHAIVFGELYGHKVQDLTYGLFAGQHALRIFDVMIDHIFQPWDVVVAIADELGLQTVPLLYRGPFDREKVLALRDGPSTLPGAAHVREGVVVKADPDRVVSIYDPSGAVAYQGRAALKYISDAYLERRDAKDGH